MAKDKGRFTEGFDDEIAAANAQLEENTRHRIASADSYLTRKNDARFDIAEGKLLEDPNKTALGHDKNEKAEFAKRVLNGVEQLKGSPSADGESAFRHVDTLSRAPKGRFAVADTSLEDALRGRKR